MGDINTVTLAGRLTRDAELSYTDSGTALLKFSLAVGRSVKRNGQWEKEASFFDHTLWGKRGESLAQYMKKGNQIIVSGELVQDRWKNKEGESRSKVVVSVGNIQLVGGNRDGDAPRRESHDPAARTPSDGMQGSFDDDIPF